MGFLYKILAFVVALQHVYFLYLEMFAWTTKAKKVFKSMPEHLFEPTKTLAANQGLYNGFLAAGLVWSVFITDTLWSVYIALFFFSCVCIAGVYGGYTASKTIFYVQGIPALLGILACLASLFG